MKKNLNGIVLVAEIFTIILFHTVKIRHAETAQPENAIARINRTSMNISKTTVNTKSKPEYIFVNIVK